MNDRDAHRAGFALAATIADDRGAARAVGGLTRGAERRLTLLARQLADAPAAQRRAEVRRMVSDRIGGGPAPAVDPPRAGYVPEPGLLALLRAIAAAETAES